MEHYECTGCWWMPDTPETLVYGTLKYLPTEGYILETTGFFLQNKSSEFKKELSKELTTTDIILGLTSENEEITLYKCTKYQQSERSRSGRDIYTSKYYISYVIVGCHFEKKEDIEFKYVSVNYRRLNEWVGICEIERVFKQDPEGNFKELNFNYNIPDKINLNLRDFNLVIEWGFHSSLSVDACELSQTTFIRIEPPSSKTFDHFLEIHNHIQKFLSLGLREATYPLIMEGRNEKYCHEHPFTKKMIYNNIRIFITDISENDNKPISTHKMLFSYSDIGCYLEKCLNNWFIKKDDLEPVYDLYLGITYIPSMYLHHKFLSLIQALESYHRRMCPGHQYFNEDEFEDIYKKMVESIASVNNDDFKQKMKNGLKYTNEFSLVKRLRLIMKTLDEEGIGINRHDKEKEVIITDIKDIRNELTHYNKNSENKYKDYSKVAEYNEIMGLLIEMCLILELDIPNEKVIELFNRRKSLNFISMKYF